VTGVGAISTFGGLQGYSVEVDPRQFQAALKIIF
jgi:hypothetical protein